MCFLREQADYVVNGEWTQKAAEAARYYGRVNVVGSSEATGFDRLPTGWQPTPGRRLPVPLLERDDLRHPLVRRSPSTRA